MTIFLRKIQRQAMGNQCCSCNRDEKEEGDHPLDNASGTGIYQTIDNLNRQDGQRRQQWEKKLESESTDRDDKEQRRPAYDRSSNFD